MAGIKLKVSTDTLKAQSQMISEHINKIENNWNELKGIIQDSKSYWEGDASDYHRKYLKDNREDVEKLMKRLREHPTELQQMAGIYIEAEEEAKEAASALPDDVIS